MNLHIHTQIYFDYEVIIIKVNKIRVPMMKT